MRPATATDGWLTAAPPNTPRRPNSGPSSAPAAGAGSCRRYNKLGNRVRLPPRANSYPIRWAVWQPADRKPQPDTTQPEAMTTQRPNRPEPSEGSGDGRVTAIIERLGHAVERAGVTRSAIPRPKPEGQRRDLT